MADIKISQLGAAIAVGDTDLVPIVSGGNTLKATAAQVKEHSIGNTNISSIGDGSVTGAISTLNTEKQPQTLANPLTIGGVSKTTVEDALGGLVSENQTLTNETADIVNTLSAKNLLPNTGVNKSENGVSFTVRDDGSVYVSGTASANVSFTICEGWGNDLENGKQYRVTGCPSGGSNSTYKIKLAKTGGAAVNDFGTGTLFTFDSSVVSSTAVAQIAIYLGANVNLTFKPMIRPVSIVDNTYVPYAMTNSKLTQSIATRVQKSQYFSDSSTTNFNSITTSGIYFVKNSNSNAPYTDYARSYLLICGNFGSGFATQIAQCLTDGKMFTRCLFNGTWTTWT